MVSIASDKVDLQLFFFFTAFQRKNNSIKKYFVPKNRAFDGGKREYYKRSFETLIRRIALFTGDKLECYSAQYLY